MAYPFNSVRLRGNATILDGFRFQNSLAVWVESIKIAEYSFNLSDYLLSVEQSYLLSNLSAGKTTSSSCDILATVRKRRVDLSAIHRGLFLQHSFLCGSALRYGPFQQHQKLE
jgi:hypothetical protein